MFLRAALLSALWFGALGAAAQEPQGAFVLPPAPATAAAHVDFYSDHFDYAESSGVIHLQGRVLMKESSWTIRSDEVLLYLESKRAEAFGFLQMEDGASLAFGDEGSFDFETHKGFLKEATAGFAPWRIHGASAAIAEDHRIEFKHASFTSCNLDENPHYHFQSASVRIRPNRWLYAWNTVFYAGRAPLFYTPFLWKSLRKKHILRARFKPGYDRRNGGFLKTSTLYDVSPSLRGKLFLDHYGHQGFGFGNELDLSKAGAAHGGLYGYRLREKSGQERWAVLGDDFQVLPSSLSFQMRLQAQSDPAFNNDYSRSSSFPITPQLVNSGAFARATRTTTTRLSYSRLDQENPALRRYAKSQEHAPRLDFQTAPLSLARLPWLNTFTGFADNSFDSGRSFLQRSAGAGWQARRTIPLFRGARFEPTAGLTDAYESRRDQSDGALTRTTADAFTGRYNAGGDLRFDTILGSSDLEQSYQRRLAPDALNADSTAVDRGVERNLLSLTHVLRPSRRVFARLQSGFDWRVFRDHTVGFRDRVQPFAADVAWLAAHRWSLLLHDSYQLNQGNQTIAVQSDWGERTGNFLGFGLGNNQTTASHYFLSEEFALAPSSGAWKVGGALRQDLRDARGGAHFDSIQLFDKELSVEKAWHDFIARAIFRIRPGGVKEANFRVELKLDKSRPVGPGPKSETPWRHWKSDDF